jgi:hypothetical protein
MRWRIKSVGHRSPGEAMENDAVKPGNLVR